MLTVILVSDFIKTTTTVSRKYTAVSAAIFISGSLSFYVINKAEMCDASACYVIGKPFSALFRIILIRRRIARFPFNKIYGMIRVDIC